MRCPGYRPIDLEQGDVIRNSARDNDEIDHVTMGPSCAGDVRARWGDNVGAEVVGPTLLLDLSRGGMKVT